MTSGHTSYAYNSRTTVLIFTKLSGSKHSTNINIVAENRLFQDVAMETVTNCFCSKSTS